MSTTHTTRDEAIAREIIAVIEANGTDVAARDDFDVVGIADHVLGTHADGYALTVDPDEFWRVVAEHAFTARVHVDGKVRIQTDADLAEDAWEDSFDTELSEDPDEWRALTDASLAEHGWTRTAEWDDSIDVWTVPVRRVELKAWHRSA